MAQQDAPHYHYSITMRTPAAQRQARRRLAAKRAAITAAFVLALLVPDPATAAFHRTDFCQDTSLC